MQIVQIGFFATSISTWVLIELNLISWQFLFVMSMLQGALFSFQLPARYSFIPKIVPENLVSNGIALLSSGMALVTVFSGSAVGYLYGKYGPSNVFLVISLIQLTALMLAIYLPKTEKELNDDQKNIYITISNINKEVDQSLKTIKKLKAGLSVLINND